MPALFYKTRFLIAILISALILAISCKKTVEDKTVSILEQYFEQNVLNRDFRVYLATDNGTDKTAEYDGYIFRLEKDAGTNSNTAGPMIAKLNGTVTCTGTWSCTEEFGKLGINLTQPTTPAPFIFLNRDWKFTEKAFPVMKLAPWGVASPKLLYMERL